MTCPLSDFTVTVAPEKAGRYVTGVLIGWGAKDIEGRKVAHVELQRPRVGRKTRIIGTVEEMLLVESDGVGQKPLSFAEKILLLTTTNFRGDYPITLDSYSESYRERFVQQSLVGQ